ncbi:Histone acetyltransferase KAT6A [Labeo rohita]|uniref:Histone acetyltransferase KAT6A n=1 Tax=Labeo rohita TaxID=84645 RepID=A0ABQ8L194_LABRO|nr:Histone acetyltransferase KAT6A [Labeo rohita]
MIAGCNVKSRLVCLLQEPPLYL